MLYTRAGDDGSTKTFNCDQRISKSSNIAEALGSLDEINSFLGLVKIKSSNMMILFPDNDIEISKMIEQIQQDIFIIQAEVAGSPKTISKEKILFLENIIDNVEKNIPPIKTFFISGGNEIAVLFDIARSTVRRTERRVVQAKEEKLININSTSLQYLNRLSSIFYACSRIINFQTGNIESIPNYK